MEHPGYYAILPANVRYDKDLKPMEKIMFAEITALSNKDGFCSASNRYFAELYDVDETTVRKWIGRLRDKGYCEVLITRNETKEVIGRQVFVKDTLPAKKPGGVQAKKPIPSRRKNPDPPGEKVTVNNTSINTTSINNTATEKIDFVAIANLMEQHVNGEGKDQWDAMCQASGYKGKPITVFMNWAGKANDYQLRNWKAEIPRLLTWMRNEARADYVTEKKAQGYQPAQQEPKVNPDRFIRAPKRQP